MSSVPKRLLTPAEYLARERVAEFKSEFFRGEMFAMAGANERHNLIAGNLFGYLRTALRPSGCRAYMAEMKVRVPKSGLYTYPDVALACGQIEFEDERRDVLLNPCALFEVISKTTET